MGCQYASVQRRSILKVLKESLSDRPSQDGRDMSENEVRYKLIIDPSEDDSLIRLLISLGVLDRQNTRMYVCSDFPGDSDIQKVFLACKLFMYLSSLCSFTSHSHTSCLQALNADKPKGFNHATCLIPGKSRHLKGG